MVEAVAQTLHTYCSDRGFLVLGLGPEGVGRLLGGSGVFPSNVFAVWRQLPGALIAMMSVSLLLGERLPPLRTAWSISGSHVIMIGVMSMGQMALVGIVVWFLLEPAFGIDSKAAALSRCRSRGGHGTLAGLARVLRQYGVGDLLYIRLGLATIGMVSGRVVGTMLVNWAIRSPSITVARQNPPSSDEGLDIDHHLPGAVDPPIDEWKGMTQVTAAAVFPRVTIAVALALLELFRTAFHLAGSNFFNNFRFSPSPSQPPCSFNSAQGGTISTGLSIAAPSKGSGESRSTVSLSARSARCRWRR
jgi:glutamate:Na+ symporter, ESS family